MTILEQPDLFGEWDKREQREAERRRKLLEAAKEVMCPCCKSMEPSAWILDLNHGVDVASMTIGGWPIGRHPVYGRQCVAQSLVSAHLTYAILNDRAPADRIARCEQLNVDPAPIIAKAQAQRDLLCDTCRRATKTIHNHCATCAHEETP